MRPFFHRPKPDLEAEICRQSGARGGARRVLAVDNNSLACQVAAANCRLNGVVEIVTVNETDLRRRCPDTGPFDLVIANLYQDLLGELFQKEIFWRSRRERWCVSVLSNARGFCERLSWETFPWCGRASRGFR